MKKMYELLPFLVIVLIIIVGAQSFLLFKMYNQDTDTKVTDQTFSIAPNTQTNHTQQAATNKNTAQPMQSKQMHPQHIMPLFGFDKNDQWNPFAEMQRMQQQMDQMFQHSLNRFNKSPQFKNFSSTGISFTPEIDIKESEKEYVAKLDLPGMDKATIDVKVDDRLLTVSGTRKEQKEEKTDDNFFRQEISYGHFSRAIPLPGPIDQDAMEAKYENGVLTVKMPKKGKSDTVKKVTIS